MDIFEEHKNHRVFLDHKDCKKINFSESRLYMAMQGCISVLRVGAQKSIWTYLKSPKIIESSKTIKFAKRSILVKVVSTWPCRGAFRCLGWSLKIGIDIFKEPKNHRVFQDHKVCKKMNFSQSRLYMAMQGCISWLRVGAQK